MGPRPMLGNMPPPGPPLQNGMPPGAMPPGSMAGFIPPQQAGFQPPPMSMSMMPPGGGGLMAPPMFTGGPPMPQPPQVPVVMESIPSPKVDSPAAADEADDSK